MAPFFMPRLQTRPGDKGEARPGERRPVPVGWRFGAAGPVLRQKRGLAP